MEKTLSTPVVKRKKETRPVKTPDEGKEAKLTAKKDPDLQNVFDDHGEMEDLYEIYGEMIGAL